MWNIIKSNFSKTSLVQEKYSIKTRFWNLHILLCFTHIFLMYIETAHLSD